MRVADGLPGRIAGGDALCATAAFGGGGDGAQLNPVVNGPVIKGQTWRVNRFVPPTALSAGRRA